MTKDTVLVELLAACELLAESHARALRAIQNLTTASLDGRSYNDAALLAHQEQWRKLRRIFSDSRMLVAQYKT